MVNHINGTRSIEEIMETLLLTFTWIFFSMSVISIVASVVAGCAKGDAEDLIIPLIAMSVSCLLISSLFFSVYNNRAEAKIEQKSIR